MASGGTNRWYTSGLVVVLASTVAAGTVAYFVTWLVARQIGLDAYATFAAFWSLVYLIIAALAGVQQEVARGTQRVIHPTVHVPRARNFGAVSAAIIFVLVAASSPLWVDGVFGEDGWSLVLPLAVAASSYVLVTVLTGSLYGLGAWNILGLLMFTDAALRLGAVAAVLVGGGDMVWLAWAIALPFPATLIILWPIIRSRLVGRIQLDSGYRVLITNIGHTLVASISTGLMISGFPVLLTLASPGEPNSNLGLYVLSITLTRAPLVVVLMSMQSYLVVSFRSGGSWKPMLRIFVTVGMFAWALGLMAWTLGPGVFSALFPNQPRPDGWFLSMLVMSSALVGSLCVTGAALLSRSRHVVYGMGWLGAAIVTVVMLVLPLDFTTRTVLALLVGPIVGLSIHAGALLAEGQRRPGERPRGSA